MLLLADSVRQGSLISMKLMTMPPHAALRPQASKAGPSMAEEALSMAAAEHPEDLQARDAAPDWQAS